MSDRRPEKEPRARRLDLRRLVPQWPWSTVAAFWPAAQPLDLRFVGRTLMHAAAVGVAAGLLGAAFFAGLELGQRVLLERLTGYAPLRAFGETFLAAEAAGTFRPWLLALLPAAGGLVSGLVTARFAPEAAGGGGDAVIEAYHHGGVVRRRVLPVKALAAIATLATGGSGGREGPTMHLGGAIGALVGRWVPTSARERRILVVAGIAAGISAVFRTPLGAALLATEMMYRDDFESDALVPSILSSVVAYSVAISLFGQTTLFAHPRRFAFVPAHLALYAALALVTALASVGFVQCLRGTRGLSVRSRLPRWAQPAAGGLAMGLLGTAVVLLMTRQFGPEGARLGVFGGGYGVAQVAIAGPFPVAGWRLVGLLVALFAAKLVATSLTIGSGGAAGDFAPSLVMGGLLGSAFGHAAALVLHDPRIDPAAFALVGMGTFYGGISHTPLSALVLVSELAGSYDLLVQMMLAVSIAFVALGRWTLYAAQPPTKLQSPAAQVEAQAVPGVSLEGLRARDVLVAPELAAVAAGTRAGAIAAAGEAAARQRVVVVADAAGVRRGLVAVSAASLVSGDDDALIAAVDLMVPFASVPPDATLAEVSVALQRAGLPQLPVCDAGEVVGWVGEGELARAYATAAAAR